MPTNLAILRICNDHSDKAQFLNFTCFNIYDKSGVIMSDVIAGSDKEYIYITSDSQNVNEERLSEALEEMKQSRSDIMLCGYININGFTGTSYDSLYKYAIYPNLIIKRNLIYHLPLSFIDIGCFSPVSTFLYIAKIFNKEIHISNIEVSTVESSKILDINSEEIKERKYALNLYENLNKSIKKTTTVCIINDDCGKYICAEMLSAVLTQPKSELILVDEESYDGLDYKRYADAFNALYIDTKKGILYGITALSNVINTEYVEISYSNRNLLYFPFTESEEIYIKESNEESTIFICGKTEDVIGLTKYMFLISNPYMFDMILAEMMILNKEPFRYAEKHRFATYAGDAVRHEKCKQNYILYYKIHLENKLNKKYFDNVIVNKNILNL